ncbi:DUF1329 domain-containing protein [Solimonas sp. SE-A11]|uniref:DUF1329 domain-containing protein n=1 Tax=Solimonas sp. SE-A11 TaxID=3054954 RepID=UPI00259C7BF4|nr:DUF1329 domain-containing protein [Solimonas sp. SE-A11]MDM4770107.1 DUF1329 domain-containing protein [Solimonas sp. SE-A11]
MKPILATLAASVLLLAAVPAAARVTEREAAQLGARLTPVGAEKAGNQDGSIPAWVPGKQRGSLAGEFYTDPAVEADKPLYTITRANMAQYAPRLSEGHKKLLAAHDSYKMLVYPSHRQSAWPEPIYAATRENAVRCELRGSDDLYGCRLGFPFPIPKSGAEAIWNHKLKWRGESVTRYNNQMIVQPNGQYQLTKIIEDVRFVYASIKNPVTLGGGQSDYLHYMARTIAPPRLSGTTILVHDKVGTGSEGRAAWLYTPTLKRVRRAPTVCCDNPAEGTDGNQFYDQVDMYNGVLERYNWKLLGKREMILPYDPYRLISPKTRFADLARPRHLNQDLARYELHRVWVVEAELRPGETHAFKRRRFYLDEDGWAIAMVDNDDNRGQLVQFQEGHIGFGYNILATSAAPEVIYHFGSGRYFITTLFNEDKPYDFTQDYRPDYFSAATVQKRATR